jgi:flagellar basal-body rod modification protein FlgD
MSTTSPLNTTASSGLNLQSVDPSLQLQTKPKKTSNALDQNSFLQLMIQEFKNQDPTKPQDPSQFLSQLAQFSSVTGIADIKTAIGGLTDATLANQALQASTIVGHQVLSAGNAETLTPGRAFSGAADLPVAGSTGFVQITDANGALVRQIPLGNRGAGLAQFTWDGKNSSGTAMPAG